jgi:hypothetical protein
MPLRKKLAVISIFAFGGVAVVMSIICYHPLLAVNSLLNTSCGLGELVLLGGLNSNCRNRAQPPCDPCHLLQRSSNRKSEILSNRQSGSGKQHPFDGFGQSTRTHGLSYVLSLMHDAPLSQHQGGRGRNVPIGIVHWWFSGCPRVSISCDISHPINSASWECSLETLISIPSSTPLTAA